MTGAEFVFDTISRRDELGSFIITPDRPFDEWAEASRSKGLAGAILDRQPQHARIPAMNGARIGMRQSGKAAA